MNKKNKIKKRNKKKKENSHLEGIIKITAKGFAFVEIEDLDEDVYIHRTKINGAMHNDTVKIELIPSRGNRPEGMVVKVVLRAKKEIVGIFEKQKSFGFVVPQNPREEDIFIPKKFTSGAQTGDAVVAKIIKYPEGADSAEGKITEIIAKKDEPGADIKILIREKGVIETFPSAVMGEASYVSKGEIEKGDRVDLRKRLLCTIDGDDSKDFDDAVSLEKNQKGNYILGVHIADVAHYVTEGSPLDKEAYKRGNSIYLLDRVVPMLPQSLSNGLCSLNPKEDRLTLSINMEIDKELKVIDYEIYESIINSKYRLTYNKVSDFIEEGIVPKKENWSDELKETLIEMNKLAVSLGNERHKLGSIDFDLDESHIKLNEVGIPVEIGIADRRCANKLIEEFMLLANKTVAEHFYHLEIPFVYRSHNKPEPDTMETLKRFLKGLGISMGGNPDSIHPKQISNIIEGAAGTKYGMIVSTVVLRSMQKAVYDTIGEGHFGLAFRYYSHFTSPIRRYSDLLIHRIIKDFLKGEDVSVYKEISEKASKNCSETERLAIDLEREVEKLKKAEYMTYHIGEVFDGIISGVTSFGIYVELENTVEGMIRMADLSTAEVFQYDQESKAAIGVNTGKRYTLGDKITIEVLDASVEKRQIDFSLA